MPSRQHGLDHTHLYQVFKVEKRSHMVWSVTDAPFFMFGVILRASLSGLFHVQMLKAPPDPKV